MKKRAHLVVDVQESFRGSPLWEAVSDPRIVQKVAELVEGARAEGEPVVWVLHSEEGSGTLFDPALGFVRLMDGLEPAEGEPVLVGRAPDGDGGITLGQWLNDEARRWISRSHLRIELHGGDLVAHDVSTNGSGVRPAGSMVETERVALPPRQRRVLGRGDLIELYPGVQIGRPGELPAGASYTPTSVMAEAPTMAMRLPRP